jgi:hypothetical protein
VINQEVWDTHHDFTISGSTQSQAPYHQKQQHISLQFALRHSGHAFALFFLSKKRKNCEELPETFKLKLPL